MILSCLLVLLLIKLLLISQLITLFPSQGMNGISAETYNAQLDTNNRIFAKAVSRLSPALAAVQVVVVSVAQSPQTLPNSAQTIKNLRSQSDLTNKVMNKAEKQKQIPNRLETATGSVTTQTTTAVCAILYELHYNLLDLDLFGDPQSAYELVTQSLAVGLTQGDFSQYLQHYAAAVGNTDLAVVTSNQPPQLMTTYISTAPPEKSSNTDDISSSSDGAKLSTNVFIIIIAGACTAGLMLFITLCACCICCKRNGIGFVDSEDSNSTSKKRSNVSTPDSGNANGGSGVSGNSRTTSRQSNSRHSGDSMEYTALHMESRDPLDTPTAVAVIIHNDSSDMSSSAAGGGRLKAYL